MPCGRCGAQAAVGATSCDRCGAALPGAAKDASALSGDRLQVALDALRGGRSADGLACPRCGGLGLQTIRPDVETIVFSAVALLLFGVVGLILLMVAGDVGLFVADLSTLATGSLLVGLLLLAIALHHRRPSAYECRACGYRVP